MRLVIPDRLRSGRAQHDESYVEMEMGGFAGSGRDLVHIEIDGGNAHRQAGDPGLLLGFGQRDDGEITVPIGVTPGLQPSVELDVVKDEGRPPGGVDDGGRSGQVTRETRPVESIGVSIDRTRESGAGSPPARHRRVRPIRSARWRGTRPVGTQAN